MGELWKKFLRFLLVSGVGWVIDFSVYICLTRLWGFPVAWANYLSSLPAITFVFFVSTRRNLVCRPGGVGKGWKYAVYVIYQLLLITAVSWLAQWLYGVFVDVVPSSAPLLIRENLKLAAKICITPITMICNFFVLKWIAEKL